MKFNKWDVWLANVEFEDAPETGKIRPVLIVGHQEVLVLSLSMTGTERPQDYKIQDLQSAGLNKDTFVRTHKINKMSNDSFIKQLGTLHPIDIRNFTAHFDKIRTTP